jgi:hypothetical protein
MTIQLHRRPEHSPSRHIPKGGQGPLTHSTGKDHAQGNDGLPAEPEESGHSAALSRIRDETQAKEALIKAVQDGNFKTIEQRVFYILNHYPATRDCDIDLQHQYWLHWDGWDGQAICPSNYRKKLTRLSSIIRVRARIQNRYGLFQATEAIRKRRRALSEEERLVALNSPDRFDYISVYADESGKTSRWLIVGGIWLADPREIRQLQQALADWRSAKRFESELHFNELKPQKLILYREALDVALSAAPSMAFKALKLPNSGLANVSDALDNLFYHYIVKGVEHEHKSMRCALPRQVRFWKDQEQPGIDSLRIRNIQDQVVQYGLACHGGRLAVGEFECKPSDQFDLLQLADLFVGAIGRRLNPGEKRNHKDEFADYLLERVGMPKGPAEFSDGKDVSALFDL